jgi:uncharacterized cupin superfamily protein
MEIIVQQLSSQEIEEKGIMNWPIWTKDVSVFDWHYDATEECLLMQGLVEVTTKKGVKVTIKAGDFVIFPQGLTCIWKVIEPVKKHYRFT